MASSAVAKPGFLERHDNVYMFVPNLIGYARIAASLFSFSVAFHNPLACVLAYFIGFCCDELDGRFARMFNQTSTLGAVLDMVTDRVSTSGLLTILCMIYQQQYMVFLSLLMLDIFSHWFQMYSSMLAGSSTHKDVKSRSWLVRTYYKNRIFMGFCCVSCEVGYLALYLLGFPSYSQWAIIPVRLPAGWAQQLPLALQPLLLPLLQPLLRPLVRLGGIPFIGLLAALAIPGICIKQITNWVQLRNACALLAELDAKKAT